jgi:hypothetical protein
MNPHLKLLDRNCAQIGTPQQRPTSPIPSLPKSLHRVCQKAAARIAAKLRCGYPLKGHAAATP